MLGSPDPSLRRAVVVGAGAAGLLAAYRLDLAGYEVELRESAPAAGGLIRTARGPLGMAESAAHSLLVSQAVARLCAELGVELLPVRRHERYVFRGGRMRRMPLGFGEALGALWRAATRRAGAPGSGGPAGSGPAVTLEQWGRAFLGDAAVDYGLDPFLRGIYAARPSEIGLEAAFPSLRVPEGATFLGSRLANRRAAREAAAREGRPLPERSRMMAPAGGMGALTGALERCLRERLGPRFKAGRRVGSLAELRAEQAEGEAGRAGAPFNLVLAVPAPEAARLLRPEAPELAAAIDREVRYAPLVSVTAFVPAALVARARGVGVLVPEREPGRSVLGILFNSSSFAGRVADESAMQSFTLMFGGTANPGALEWDDARVRAEVERELGAVLGFGAGDRAATQAPEPAPPIELMIHRWERAVPIYSPRLPALWEEARRAWCARPGRLLAGNWTGQVSLRGMIEEWERLES